VVENSKQLLGAFAMNFQPGQIVENHLPGLDKVIVCRVIAKLTFDGAGEDMYRVTDVRETDSDIELIMSDRTWGAPAENLRAHEADCYVCHKAGLVTFG
jgi:hypothetical protein